MCTNSQKQLLAYHAPVLRQPYTNAAIFTGLFRNRGRCGSQLKTRDRKLGHIVDTATTSVSKYPVSAATNIQLSSWYRAPKHSNSIYYIRRMIVIR